MQLFQTAIDIIWFFLPGYAANMAPVIAARFNWMPSLNVPLDASRSWRGKRLLGNNKTWRGIVAAVIAGSLMGLYQYFYAREIGLEKTAIISYKNIYSVLLISLALSIGSLGGDILKSFVKRRLNFSPGERWFPWDQMDSTLGMIFTSLLFATLNATQILLALIIAVIATYIVSYVAVALFIKKNI